MRIIKSPVLIVFLIAILSMSWFTYKIIIANRKAMEFAGRVQHSDEVLRSLHGVSQLHAEITSALHGYVATGDSSFLILPEKQLDAQLDALDEIIAGNPILERLTDSLNLLLKKRLDFDANIKRTANESADLGAAMLQNTYGRSLQDGITDITRKMIDEERRSMAKHIVNHRFYAGKVYYLSIAGSIICLLFLIIGVIRFIFEQARNKAAETQLRNSEIKYRRLIEDAEVIMYTTNRGGYFTYISPKVESITGHTNTELLGKHYSLFLDPEVHEELARHYEEQARNQVPATTREFQIIRKNGSRIWVEQHAMLLRDHEQLSGYQCIVKDIDERKRFQGELRQSEQEKNEMQIRLHSLMDNTTSIIFIKDLGGRYLLVNKKFEETYQVSHETIIGKTDADFPHIFTSPTASTDKEVLGLELPVELEDNIMVNGRKHYYLTTKFPLRDTHQQVFGLCGISTDISDRIEHEHQLVAAKRSAEAAKRAQEIFMANVSHEIRTPMNGIIGMTNLLRKTPLHPDQKEFIDAIKDSANNLLVIINDILDFSKIKSGKMLFEKTNFDIRYLVRKTVYPFIHKANEKGLELVSRVDDAVPPSLIGDPVRLRQVLENLLSNAIKFTEKGSISLTVSLRSIDDAYSIISFEVRDTGIGIPEQMLSEVFESFTQSHAGIDRKYGGTGLGLAICKKLVELQHGHIWLDSKPGEGTGCRFEIPYTRNLFTSQEETVLSETPNVSLSTRELLVAEDNLINQKVAMYTLQRAGARVDIVPNGSEAVKRIKEKQYDCVLMDLQMPEMDGYKATLLIRELGYTVPIIAMTASAINGEREKCVRAGMNDYISKPFIPEELYKKINEVITRTARSLENKAAILEHAEPMTLIDRHYLQALAEHDKDYLLDIVALFRKRGDLFLQQLLASAQKQIWPEVEETARQLRQELNTIRIIPLIDLLLQIERRAMEQEGTENILPDVQFAIKLYKEADEVIREELAFMN